MSPSTFLRMAKHISTPDKDKLAGVTSAAEKSIKFDDITYLVISDTDDKNVQQVTGHEGRHRAMYLQSIGVSNMPVVIKSYNIRWGCQTREELKYDYIKDWPTTLIDENGRSHTFPISRDAYYVQPEERFKLGAITESRNLYSKDGIQQIIESLNFLGKPKYVINDDLSVDFLEDLTIDTDHYKFTYDEIPFKIGRVHGDFIVYSGHLKSFKNFPHTVDRDFKVVGVQSKMDRSKIKVHNLKDAPQNVRPQL